MLFLKKYIQFINLNSYNQFYYANSYKWFLLLFTDLYIHKRYLVIKRLDFQTKVHKKDSLLCFLIIFNFFFCYSTFLDLSIYKYGHSNLPKKYKTFTILKSPHGDKKSREQFHLIQYKKILNYPIFISSNNSFFFYYYSVYSGIKVSNYQIQYII